MVDLDDGASIPLTAGSLTLGAKLRQVREERAISQAQAAHSVGVTQVTWSRWETGRSRVQRRHWNALADFLGFESRDFMRLLDDESVARGRQQVVVPLRSGESARVLERPQPSGQSPEFSPEQRETLAAINRCMDGHKLEPHEIEWFRYLVKAVGLERT